MYTEKKEKKGKRTKHFLTKINEIKKIKIKKKPYHRKQTDITCACETIWHHVIKKTSSYSYPLSEFLLFVGYTEQFI